ncbi:hypothetical protein [Stenotrophomonas rhizophila]|uniref:hypothetical protein n=1 Tax=Stenotrophomonas rhizophila TaxID=216778 RepID=UPI0033984A87
MSTWRGVFRCDRLGVDDCVVWWDALAAAGNWATVVVAVFSLWIVWIGTLAAVGSAYAVWRLGREANRLAAAPSEVAKRQESQERVVLLSALYGETLFVSSSAGALYNLIGKKYGVEHMLDTKVSRQNGANALRELSMPLTMQVMGRLHVLPAAESSSLAQCLGIISILHTSADSFEAADRGVERAEGVIRRVISDLGQLEQLADRLSGLCEQQIYSSQH